MKILVDANLWLRSAQPNHPQHAQATSASISLRAAGHSLVVVPQVLYEFWVVATRPIEQNGLGFSASRTAAEIEALLAACPMHSDDRLIFEAWHELVSKHQVLGKKAHDARLVAAMLRHGVTHLLTFNVQDFARFSEITVIPPEAATSLPPATA